jgi:hypothetical protein
MGVDYNTESDCVQARAQQVTHHVTTNYLEKDSIMGDPQVIDLPFRCLEGEVETNFLYSPVQMPKFKGVKHSHQQFAIFLAFKEQSAEDYKEEFVNTSTARTQIHELFTSCTPTSLDASSFSTKNQSYET